MFIMTEMTDFLTKMAPAHHHHFPFLSNPDKSLCGSWFMAPRGLQPFREGPHNSASVCRVSSVHGRGEGRTELAFSSNATSQGCAEDRMEALRAKPGPVAQHRVWEISPAGLSAQPQCQLWVGIDLSEPFFFFFFPLPY